MTSLTLDRFYTVLQISCDMTRVEYYVPSTRVQSNRTARRQALPLWLFVFILNNVFEFTDITTQKKEENMVAATKILVYIGVPLFALILVVGMALGFIFFYKNPEATPEFRKKLVIDHDGGADDAFAITMSLLYEKYFGGPNVVALTTTYGNVNLSQVIINSDRILRLANRQDVPIYEGSYRSLITGVVSDYFFGFDGLGDDGYLASGPIPLEELAPIALLELSKKYEGELIVVAIGPLTNLALAVSMDPDFIGRLSHLYIGAGHIQSQEHPDPEFNAQMDPEAYHIVTNSSYVDKVTVVPFSQVYNHLNVPLDWRKGVLGKIQTPMMEALNGFERLSLPKETDWTQLDPATMAIVLDNSLVDEFRNSSNGIILEGSQRGINTNNFSSTEPNIRVAYTPNMEKYKKFLLDVYSAELQTLL
ncbi:hypothetical protein PYW07_014319 [Mythimna separata]|uniref:Inosine/uridine-preferring nucleoside hydrolase domain-containing protein n=1 Tax=Mythimna separata TaxID=271217 RepID=A0AAD7Z0C7_MYTSE|nr:hypothetical protein PYW07_014319 [Mythimna separata]